MQSEIVKFEMPGWDYKLAVYDLKLAVYDLYAVYRSELPGSVISAPLKPACQWVVSEDWPGIAHHSPRLLKL